MDISKLTGYRPGPFEIMAQSRPTEISGFSIVRPKGGGLSTSYFKYRADAALFAAAPALLELAKLGLELAGRIQESDCENYEILELARALREKVREL